MKKALLEAFKAAEGDEVPVGAVIVRDGKILCRAHNQRNKTGRATAHAEMLAIEKACKKIGDWRLNGCQLFVTLEPCLMCLGACSNARIDKVFFGAYDTNRTAKPLVLEQFNTLNHNLTIEGGILENECSEVLKQYFKNKRK